MTTPREEFLAADRPEDVLIYVADDVLDDPQRLAAAGASERVPGGVVVVVDGETGRRVFEVATGLDPMAFAQDATEPEGAIHPELTGGDCPDDPGDRAGTGDGEAHAVRFVFSFAQPRTEGVDGPYAEGDVVHAYAACACGTTYSRRWVLDEGESVR